MPANTYTWTCPRCKFAQTSGAPSAPSNCPRCNYPDAAPSDMPDPNSELERDVGPEVLLNMSEEQANRMAAGETHVGPIPISQPAVVRSAGTLDPGWLRAVVDDALEATGYRLSGPKGSEDRVALFVAEVAERYAQPRPQLLCGCARGTHADTFAAMQEAHPERAAR